MRMTFTLSVIKFQVVIDIGNTGTNLESGPSTAQVVCVALSRNEEVLVAGKGKWGQLGGARALGHISVWVKRKTKV